MNNAKSTTVTEIHEYPLRPAGFAEPLFHSKKSRKEILEHFVRSSWLSRASEAPPPARTFSDSPVSSSGSTAEAYRVIASWREVDRWWEPGGGVDVVWRLVESGRPGRGKQEIMAEPVAA